jgi:hypothetical protein
MWRIRRDPISIATNTYSARKFTVTQVRKSQDYGFGVIADECGPSLAGAAARLTGIQIPPYRSGRDLDTELQLQFGGDALFAPGRILTMHLANQCSDVLW